jgi:hypothetical protein
MCLLLLLLLQLLAGGQQSRAALAHSAKGEQHAEPKQAALAGYLLRYFI